MYFVVISEAVANVYWNEVTRKLQVRSSEQ